MNTLKTPDHLFSLLPNPKTENWKYTNIRKFLPKELAINDKKKVDLNLVKKTKSIIGGPYSVWFKNGVLDVEMSTIPRGMTIQKRAPINDDDHGFYFNSSGTLFSQKTHKSNLFNQKERLDNLLRTNNLYHDSCYMLEFEEGFSCDGYIEINHAFNSAPSQHQKRLLFLIKKGARVKILEQTTDLSGERNFKNSVAELICLEGAFLEHVVIQKGGQCPCSVNNFFVTQQKNSRSFFYNFALSGKMSRNNYHVALCEPSSSTNLSGFSCIKERDHVDNFINVIHASANCKSSQLFKNIYDNNASGVFYGGIYVDKDSQKTEAFQQNNNILLSENSNINAIPQLEIFADDVSCSHGCTIGQPDFNAVFYLQSRGINRKDAVSLLNLAFLSETFKNVSSEDLRLVIHNMVLKQLGLTNYS